MNWIRTYPDDDGGQAISIDTPSSTVEFIFTKEEVRGFVEATKKEREYTTKVDDMQLSYVEVSYLRFAEKQVIDIYRPSVKSRIVLTYDQKNILIDAMEKRMDIRVYENVTCYTFSTAKPRNI